MADDFFTLMLAGDAQKAFDSELDVGSSNGDQLLTKLGVPTGRLTDESLTAFEKLAEGEIAQLALQRKFTVAAKTYTNAIASIGAEENKRREQGILTQQKLNELKAEAATAWAKYQSQTQVLMSQTKNSVNLLGAKTQQEVIYQNKVHLLKQEQERERYAARYQQAEARHQGWLQNLREGIAAAISQAKGKKPQLPSGNKVFGIFETRKERA
jgi:hypothetical protein